MSGFFSAMTEIYLKMEIQLGAGYIHIYALDTIATNFPSDETSSDEFCAIRIS